MQTLIYGLIGLGSLAVGVAVYFGLAFPPAEAILVVGLFWALALIFFERTMRRRTEARLGRAVEELSRLLAGEAKAGAALSQQVEALVEAGPDHRLDSLEADVAVLGKVVRQVTETVAAMEAGGSEPPPPPAVPHTEDRMADAPYERGEPLLPLEEIAAALDADRLVCHIAPIVMLPQRWPRAHDVIARIALESGGFLERAEFRPAHSARKLARRIDRLILEEAMGLGRRVRAIGRPLPLYVPIGQASLAEDGAVEVLAAKLEADPAAAEMLCLVLDEAEWWALTPAEQTNLGRLHALGPSLGLGRVESLRLDCGALAEAGISSLRVAARTLIETPSRLTDFATADLPAYLARYGISLIVSGITDEQQIITLLEDGLTSVAGPHIGGPGPARPEQMVERAGPAAVAGAALLRRA